MKQYSALISGGSQLSRVYAQVRIARRDGKSMVLRTMVIAD